MSGRLPGPPEHISSRLGDNLKYLEEKLAIGKSIDVLKKDMNIGGKKGALIFVDGLTNGDVAAIILQTMAEFKRSDLLPASLPKLMTQKIPYIEIETSNSLPYVIDEILSGQMAFLLDNEKEAILIDTRTYPVRSPEGPIRKELPADPGMVLWKR